MSKTVKNYRLQMPSFCSRFGFFAFFLCVFYVFAAQNFFAQNYLDLLAEQIRFGTAEAKRDALFQIRNLESAEASRLAIPALSDSAEIVRATAAFSVIFLPPDEAAQVLLPLLQDKKALVRREAAYALGKVRNPAAINPLIRVFQKDKITEVRNAVVISLGEIGDASAVDFLTRILLKKPKKNDPGDDFLRRSAARSIGQTAQIIQIGKTEVITPKNFLPEDKKSFIQPKYADLIERFPIFRPAVAVLIQTLRNPQESQSARREAAFALGAIGDQSAIPVLRFYLNSEDYYLAEICEEAIKKISLAEDSE